MGGDDRLGDIGVQFVVIATHENMRLTESGDAGKKKEADGLGAGRLPHCRLMGEWGSTHKKLAMESNGEPHWFWSDEEKIWLIGEKMVRKVVSG